MTVENGDDGERSGECEPPRVCDDEQRARLHRREHRDQSQQLVTRRNRIDRDRMRRSERLSSERCDSVGRTPDRIRMGRGQCEQRPRHRHELPRHDHDEDDRAGGPGTIGECEMRRVVIAKTKERGAGEQDHRRHDQRQKRGVDVRSERHRDPGEIHEEEHDANALGGGRHRVIVGVLNFRDPHQRVKGRGVCAEFPKSRPSSRSSQ